MASDFVCRGCDHYNRRTGHALPALHTGQHQEPHGRRWSVWNRTLGNSEGDLQDLSEHSVHAASVEKWQAASPSPGAGPWFCRKVACAAGAAFVWQGYSPAGPQTALGAPNDPRSGGLRRHPLPDDRGQRRGQDRLLPVSQPGVCLCQRNEYFRLGYEGGLGQKLWYYCGKILRL